MLPNFSDELIRWYQKNARDLPWRHTKDPYKIWISEVMLQQTTVVAVIPYYQRWIKSFPDLKSVAQAPLSKILKHWQGLGYYNRARCIHRAAKFIWKNNGGKFPEDPEILKALPGFGPYTVGAVLSIAFDQRQPIIDANVRRVVMRLLSIRGQARPEKDKRILNFLLGIMPQHHNDFFNQGLMELGALICRPQEPLCQQCPVKKFCQAFQNGLQNKIPKPKQQKLEDMQVAVALIRKENKFFIQKRKEKGPLAGLWEFPGGKFENGETSRHALNREVKEELGCRVQSAQYRMRIRHAYTRFRVTLEVWECTLASQPHADATHRWARLNEIDRFPLPAGTVKIIRELKKGES